MAAPSVFNHVKMAPVIEVFQLTREYKEDNNPTKINLGVEAYRTDEGKPYVLNVVKEAEVQMVNDQHNHEYLPVAGHPEFRKAAIELILGPDSPAIVENRVEGIQCLGGTGCIRLAAEFLKKKLEMDTVYVSKPTWGNHKNVFREADFSNIREYRYWDQATRRLDIDGMLEDLGNAPEGCVVILHAVAHNPTGVDPTKEQWKKIAEVCQRRKLFVLMDNAYQGLASGNIEEDAYSSRLFVQKGFDFFIAQSFSGNFGLYNERTGNLCIVASKTEVLNQVKSQMENLVRTMWFNPPNYGGRVVASVLNNLSRCGEWKTTVKEMAERIQTMRRLMFEKLQEKGTPGTWTHIIEQIGMFCYTGLEPKQVEQMKRKYHIYMLKEGSINICGITTSNVDYVVSAIHDVVTG